MSLGSAASLVEEPFPFSHTIRVESQSKNRSDYDLHHPKSHHPYMRKRERLWRLLHQHPSNHSCLRIFDVMVVLPEPFGPAITIRTGRCSVPLLLPHASTGRAPRQKAPPCSSTDSCQLSVVSYASLFCCKNSKKLRNISEKPHFSSIRM